MTTITTRRLDKATYDITEKYLWQAGVVGGENYYSHFMSLPVGEDDRQMVDALIHLQGNKISIKAIWIMEHAPKEGKMTARNFHGERGQYAKILGEKYLNRFFEHLATVDNDNIEECQYLVTADLIKKIEAEIDLCIDPKHITEADISSYNRIELTLSAEQSLRYLCKRLGEKDYEVTYNSDDKVFEVALRSSELEFNVSLEDVVRKKWEMGECFAKATLICGSDLYLAADERKKRDAHYTKQLLELAVPNLRKIAGKDKAKFEGLMNHYEETLEIQILLYDEGRLHGEEGCEIWSRDEFIAEHDWLDSDNHPAHYIDLLYFTYCDGFAKTNGDTMFSGEGGIRLPAFLAS